MKKQLLHFTLAAFVCAILTQAHGQTMDPPGPGDNDADNQPPVINAEGNQYYCPLSELPVVTDITIEDPDTEEINAFYIQISEGYENGKDRLDLTGDHPEIRSQWNPSSGKLSLTPATGSTVSYEVIIDAVRDVVFSNNDPNIQGERLFSFTVGDANYLPSTGHYYEYVADVGIMWTDAKVKAEERTYNGLPGYLATITSADEAQLTGEQADGTGWIGGSDAEQEGTWKWVTGPEAGTVFWIGDVNGSAPNGAFSFWNTGEPNNLGDEDYAHVTAPNVGIRGSWNDLRNSGEPTGDYQPKGYIVEYGTGGPEDGDNFAGSSRLYTTGIAETREGSTCGPGVIALSASIVPVETNPDEAQIEVQWFANEESDTPLFVGEEFNPSVSVTTVYYVSAAQTGCSQAPRTAVQATVYEIPEIEPLVVLKNCDQDGNPNDGVTDFNLEVAIPEITKNNATLEVTFHLSEDDANSGVNALDPFPYRNEADLIYSRVTNPDGCASIGRVTFEVSVTEPLEHVILEQCDTDGTNDGQTPFDLTEASRIFRDQLPGQQVTVRFYHSEEDAALERFMIPDNQPYINQSEEFEEIYVRIDSQTNGDCLSIGPYLELYVYLLPEFDLPTEAFYCVETEFVEISVENPKGTYTYQWSDENGSVVSTGPVAQFNTPGIYSVIAVSDLSCISEERRVQIIQSSLASLNQDRVIINDGGEINSIEILTEDLGDGDYEFALLGISNGYQDEPFFDNVPPGIHELGVRDKNGCGTSSLVVSVIGYPKFFTPNGDGVYDTWQVDGISFQPGSKIYIYDKFGKLLAELDPEGPGWDGVYNGKNMPSSDYWYMVQLEDGRVHRGHFSLIQR
jgi:gliding motility-associated-like protein